MKAKSFKNTFVRTTFVVLMSSLVLTGCKKDDAEPVQEPMPTPGANFNFPEYNPIITQGCNPMNHIIDTMDFPYINIDQLIGSAGSDASKEGSFWANAGMWVLEKGGGGLVAGMFSPLGSMLTNALLNTIVGEDETQTKLNKILDKLDVIEGQMNTLMENTDEALAAIDEVGYGQLMQFYREFQSLLNDLTSINDDYMDSLRYIHENLDNMDSAETERQIARVMQHWADEPISGSKASRSFKKLVDEQLLYSVPFHKKPRNIFAIYDVTVFHNTPWERTGYDICDMFRAAVATETLRTAWLTALYYRTKNDDDEVNKIVDKVYYLYAYFASENNRVNRRYDIVKCQLSDALFVLQADALTHTSKDQGNLNGQKDAFSNADATTVSQLTHTQINQIMAYYGNSFGRFYTLLNCLQDGGLLVQGYYHTIFTFQNYDPFAISYYEDVYLMSQENDAYNVGIPFNCYVTIDGKQHYGYEPYSNLEDLNPKYLLRFKPGSYATYNGYDDI